MIYKICEKCNVEKPLTDFGKLKECSRNGKKNCKICSKNINSKNIDINPYSDNNSYITLLQNILIIILYIIILYETK
jgi:hypothetical protein